MNIFPLNLTQTTEELKKLISEHPDYPIVVLAGECASDGYTTWTFCSSINVEVAEFLDDALPFGDGKIYLDKDEFSDDLEEWLADELGYNDNPPKISDKDFEEMVNYEKWRHKLHWRKVIAIYADN